MGPHAIVSYDDTPNDRDALELGRQLQEIGARLTLAYVRHAIDRSPDREQLADREARERLSRGAALLDDPDVQRRVVISPSTGDGLAALARASGANVVVFGSDYRTPVGRVALGRTASGLLDRGPAAVAVAPAGHRARELDVVGVLPGTADEVAIETAFSIAGRHDARVTDSAHGVDLLVVGSRREALPGETMVTARARAEIEAASCPVLVVARDAMLSFETLVTV